MVNPAELSRQFSATELFTVNNMLLGLVNHYKIIILNRGVASPKSPKSVLAVKLCNLMQIRALLTPEEIHS